MFKLYTTPLSANGRKVLAVSRQLGLEPEVQLVNVYAGEGQSAAYRAINPWGKVPTLVEGDFTLWESNAILQYVAEAHGGGRLWGSTPRARADVSRWLFWESSHWQPALTPVLTSFVGRLLLPDVVTEDPGPVDWKDARLHPLLVHLDAHLRHQPWLAGGELSIADFAVAAMAMYVRSASFPFAVYPGLRAWYRRIEGLDAWRDTAVGPWSYDAPIEA